MSDDIKLMTEEEVREKLAKDRESNEMIGMYYNLIKDMPESMRKFYENQIIKTVIMGDAMGKALFRSESGSSEFNTIISTLTRASQKTKQRVDEELKDIQDRYKPGKDVND